MKELNGMSYEDFTEYIKQYVQSAADYEQYKDAWMAGRLGLQDSSSMDTITMKPPVHLAEGPFISTLWGKAVLYDTLENHTNSNRVISYIHNSLLTYYTCNIQRMDIVGGIDHKSFIISANEIQSQHINTKNKTITIPIKAFAGKSLLTLDGPPTPENPTRYYFILLQSAKDPNIVQPIKIWQGARTLEIKSKLTSQALNNEGWEVKIEQEEVLTKYINHQHTEGKDISIPLPKSLYNTATQRVTASAYDISQYIDINSITNDPTRGVPYSSSIGDLGDWISKLNL